MPHTGTSEAKSGAPPSGALPASGGSFVRRDKLMRIEEDVQRLWDKTRPYEVDVCSLRRPRFVDSEPCNGSSVKNKFFCSFPYPYMNGLLHLGHGFTLCKAEFLARYYRLRGKNVLWPFALHCTGMPILACADRLKREIEAKKKEHELQEDKKEDQQEEGGSSDPTKFSSAKSKLVAKTGGLKSQWEIMAALGVPQDEIARFADANYWLDYFPPRCKKNLIRLGVAVDWRRSFITTDRNPFYSAFVRWQFMKLMAAGKISFGTRPTVISRRELQACADHDRLSGEGIGPQEYTLIKMRIKTEQMDASHAPHAEFKAAWEKHSSTNEGQSRQIFLVAATLRPETMYGQTNCYVLPEGEYGVYLAFEKSRVSATAEQQQEQRQQPTLQEKLAAAAAASKAADTLEHIMTREEALAACNVAFICSHRSALNMAYQGLMPLEASGGADELPTPHCLHRVSGQALLGLPLAAPLASYDTVFALPMQTISLEKGTGVVTSVPTDSPDDFTTLEYIRSKIEYFNKLYGIKEEWVLPFQPVEIIEVPGLGRQAAPTLCAQLGVSGPKDTQRLQQAKEEAYRRGFYEGVMTVGPFAGRKVQEAKALVREQLLQEGSACVYYEPEKKVVARSGDECVVGLLPQWFISYGEAEWRQQVEDYISGEDFSAFSPQAQHQFAFVLSWLKEWACSRSYGLGTFLPWTVNTDNPVLIESLSDSTIYMAYYTGGDMYGQSVGPLGLKPEDLTEAFFDYIFLLSDTPPEGSAVSVDNLNLLRSEFAYWYPLDLRVSGKDLIFNHLTFCLYCHTAVWPKQQELWPRAFACNGMVLVDSEKMSKSTGNFLTIEESIEKFSADATRIAFADAGDSLDDANFQRETANAAITRLYLLEGLVADFVAGKIELRDGPLSAADELFQNEIGLCVQSAAAAYEAMQNREALKAAFYELTIKRDQYKQLVGDEKMHRDMLRMWIEAQAITLCPIAPHICEYLWSCLLKKENLVVDAAWPQLTYDSALHRKFTLLLSCVEEFRRAKEKALQAAAGGKKKGKQQQQQQQQPQQQLTHGVAYIAQEYGPLQQRVLSVLQRVPLVQGLQGQVEAPSDFMQIVKDAPELEDLDKNQKKEALAFASYQMRDELKACGRSALELRLPFSEKALLEAHRRFLEVSLELTSLEFRSSDDPSPLDSTNCRTLAKPGKPSIFFTSV
ncbi:leucine--tRNA ligase, cytoplasmic [Cyclospora cayetanensis]|uniref:leucine--tRNA ligase n=1 Tax=Cyclospora cayetanensis TaxID=88456 RepID=A0A6P6RXY2_9EIME|nr:leucine--tRNA ligase, cytoplasmic [Cyclospora cayetanensis]